MGNEAGREGRGMFRRIAGFDWLSKRGPARGREAILHGASFLMALVLLVAGYGQLAAHPVWSAIALALFGCGYAVAARVFREPLYVYPTLALWTFSFFLFCYAAGLQPLVYPVVATVLLWVLWWGSPVAGRADKRFSLAVSRCIFLTTIFFGGWTRFYHADDHTIPAVAFLLYGLSLSYFAFRRPRTLFSYLGAAYFCAGAIYVAKATEMVGWREMGVAIQPMALLLFLIAVLEQERGRGRSALAYYLTGSILTAGCLCVSLVGWHFLADQFAWMAVSLGLPVLAYERMVSAQKRKASGYVSGLSLASEAAVYGVVPFVVLGPVVSFGNTAWATLLVAAYSLYTLLESVRTRGVEKYVKRTAFLFALAGAWAAGQLIEGVASPDLWGLAVVALAWMVIWMLLRVGKRRHHAAYFSDGVAGIGSALVLVAVVDYAWDLVTCIAAAVVVAVSAIKLIDNRRSSVAVGLAAGAAVLTASGLGLLFAMPQQWQAVQIVGCAALLVSLVLGASERSSRGALSIGLSSAALSFGMISLLMAMRFSEPRHAVMCVAGAMGIPVALGGLFYRQRRWGAMAIAVTINAVAALALVWIGRTVELAWMGSAALLLVPFMAVGWMTSRFWSYAMATAGVLALGLLLLAAALLGVGWGFMLTAAILCALFLRVDRVKAVDDLTRSSIDGVAHACALLVVGALYRMSGQVVSLWAIPALLVAAGAYLQGGKVRQTRRATAYVFASLCMIPVAGFWLKEMTPGTLLVPGALVPLWAVLGLRGKGQASANACRASAFLGIFLCFVAAMQLGGGAAPLFILCLVGFVISVLAQRDRFFVQVVLLALALMGYAWIREFGSHFTQELYRVMLVILGLALFAELSPYLVRWLDRAVPVPYIRLFTWRGVGMGVGAGGLVSLICVSGFALAVTEHPTFCKSCHNMDKFFDSWQHSSHAEVACVECHYEPGVAALVEGKIGALSQVVSFATHRYGAKPHAEVSNKACQRPGCHEDITHDKDVIYDGRIHFSHDLHHDAMEKGRDLPCTTCHAQETDGDHMSLASSTCFLCHFHGDGQAVKTTADCVHCHGAPKGKIKMGESMFSHDEFFADRGKVDCHMCHQAVNRGSAAVSAVRCQSCHYGDKLGVVDLTKIKELHVAHVHDRRVACFECHGLLEHGVTTRASAKDVESCGSCHESRQHSLQAAMYLGNAVKDIKGEPNVMFEAGISCGHCHVQEKRMSLEGHEFVTHVSTAKYCGTCHGDEGYAELYEMWQEDTKEALTGLMPKLAGLRDRIDKAGGVPADALASLRGRLGRAERLCEVVRKDGSYGVHNTTYVEDILDTAKAELKAAESELSALSAGGKQ